MGWKRERGVGGDTAYVEHPPTSAAIDLLRNVLSPSSRQAHRGRSHRRDQYHDPAPVGEGTFLAAVRP